jgi:hypothetical protein
MDRQLQEPYIGDGMTEPLREMTRYLVVNTKATI